MKENVYSSQLTTEKKETVIEQKPLSALDTAFAWLSFVFAYLFCRANPANANPLGAFLFVLVIFSVTAVILKLKGAKFTMLSIFCLISAPICSAAIIVTGSELLVSLAFVYALVSYLLFIYSSLGNLIEASYSNLLFMDFIKAMFVLPFCSFAKIFSVFSKKKASGGAAAGKFMLGIALAIVPTAIVFSLLSFDDAFLQLVKNIFNFTLSDVFSHLSSLALAVPIAMYLFGLFASSDRNVLKQNITVSSCYSGFEKVKILPQVTAVAATIPLILVYVLFVASQWQYYAAAFEGVLPQALTYARYANQGFSELCAVASINLIIIGAITFFLKRNSKGKNPLLTIISVVFCVLTLALISTAMARLFLYINTYGLTQKRVLAVWFMAVIGLVFIIIALSRFIRRIKVIPCAAIACVLAFAALSLCNVSGLIARYNVNAYLNGSLSTVDVQELEELGDSAIPALIELKEGMVEKRENITKYNQYKQIEALLKDRAEELKDEPLSLFEANIPALRARQALKQSGYVVEKEAENK